MSFVDHGSGRPQPKAGYRCKICGLEGGQPDSHWYQLCPFKGTADEKRTFNPPRKGYLCKFCHKAGGEIDSHWFQQCPKRSDYEGIHVPHPLKLQAASSNPSMIGMLSTPRNLAHPVALNLNQMSQMSQLNPMNQMEYNAQFASNTMGIYMYPGSNMNGLGGLNSLGMPQMGVNSVNSLSQVGQVYFMQQQQQLGKVSNNEDTVSDRTKGLDNLEQFNLKQKFGMNAFDKQEGGEDALLNEITKQAHDMTLGESKIPVEQE